MLTLKKKKCLLQVFKNKIYFILLTKYDKRKKG